MAQGRSSKINLNNASLDELVNMPMIGRDKAQDIITHRPYKSWDDLKRVPGFSESILSNLKDNATI